MMPPRSSRPGFTLVELVVVLVVFGLVLGAVGQLMVTTQRVYLAEREESAAYDPLRQAEITLVELFEASGANPLGIGSVATGRRLPGIYSLTTPTGGYQVVADYNPPNRSLDEEFEDVRFWVASDTLFVSWRNQAGTPATARAVAAPIRSIAYAFVDTAGVAVAPAGTNRQILGAARLKLTITAPRRDRPATLITREAWVLLRNR